MTPAVRLSLGLTFLTASLVLVGDFVGVVPDRHEAVAEARKKLSESLAVQFTAAAGRGEFGLVQTTMDALVRRNTDVLSVALRAADGAVFARAGDHDRHWVLEASDESTSTHVQVPIFEGGRQWGRLEARFAAEGRAGGIAPWAESIYGLVAFVVVGGFVSFFFFFVRRALHALDPTAVIPDRVRAAFDTLTEGVLILDEAERIVLANAAFSDKSGTPVAELMGRKASRLPWERVDGDSTPLEPPWSRALARGVRQTAVAIGLAPASGARRTFMANASPITDEGGRRRGVLVTLDDVTVLEEKNAELAEMLEKLRASEDQVRRQNEELQRLALTDPLTSALNRRALFERFERLFEEATQQGKPLSVIMSDIDHFKSVNDRYGHGVGDKVIKVVAEVLRAGARSEDLVGRYGGEEFCMVLPGLDGTAAMAVADQLRVAVYETSEARFTSGLRITSSFGVAGIEEGAKDPVELVNQADRALYGSKRGGRNRVMRWGTEEVTRIEDEEARRKAAAEAGATGRRDEGGASTAEMERLRGKVVELERALESRDRELREQYGRDQVTGLPSRFLFHDRVAQATARADRYRKLVAVLSLEVSMFDRVNETLGPVAGEKLLQETARRLVSGLRRVDTVTLLHNDEAASSVSRLGGNEFGIVLSDVDRVESVTWIVERLVNSVAGEVDIEGREIYSATAVGVSVYPHDGRVAEELLKNASAARREAQRSAGRNGWKFYDQKINERSLFQMQLEQRLRHATGNGELLLHYQPRVELRSGRITGMEALVRWDHPEAGLVSPGDFIPIAEQSGIIREIGSWVLARACEQVRAWRDLDLPPVRMAVNVSPMEFQQKGFVDHVLREIGRHGVRPSDLEIEITETALMENLEGAKAAMRTLHSAGVRFAIDDFGIGYSSLSYLNALPVDVVKIDRSFVEGMAASAQQGALLAGIIAMAHGMGLRVCGEGVETQAQLAALQDLGCDEVQGFLLGRPVPQPEATAALRLNAGTRMGLTASGAGGWPSRLWAAWPLGSRGARWGAGPASPVCRDRPRARVG